MISNAYNNLFKAQIAQTSPLTQATQANTQTFEAQKTAESQAGGFSTSALASGETIAAASEWFDDNIQRFVEYGEVEKLKENYLNVLGKVHAENGLENPKEFIKSLSTEEREAIQKVNRLADTITNTEVEAYTDEGAYNLLIPPAQGQDLDGNGLTQYGRSYIFKFPSSNTPPEVANAWNEMTEGMSFKEKAMYEGKLLTQHFSRNVHIDQTTGKVTVTEPSDPNYVNPFTEGGDYSGNLQKMIKGIIGGLERQLADGDITQFEFEKETGFWNKFNSLIG